MKKKTIIISLAVIVLVLLVIFGITNTNLASFATKLNILNRGTGTNECRDGYDNDGDNHIDWPNDPGCADKYDKSELDLDIGCDDGIDNNRNGLTDTEDPNCASSADLDENI